jgi:acyl carrier protein
LRAQHEGREGGRVNAHQLLTEITHRSVEGDGHTSLHDLDGWDSLRGVRLVLRLEEILGRQLSEAELERLESIHDVERLLRGAA